MNNRGHGSPDGWTLIAVFMMILGFYGLPVVSTVFFCIGAFMKCKKTMIGSALVFVLWISVIVYFKFLGVK